MDYDFKTYIGVDFDGTPINEVFLDDVSVWKEPKILDYTFDGNAVKQYVGTESHVIIPSSYSMVQMSDGSIKYIEGSDIQVTALMERAFYGNLNIQVVEMPNGITSIGNECFTACENLQEVKMPDSITNIGASAFASSGIKTIKFPPNVSIVETNICSSCFGLTSVVLPTNVQYIEKTAFYYCQELASVEISNTPLSIGEYAFAYTNLSSLDEHLYSCQNLGVGCFAFNNAWDINVYDKSIAQRLVNTTIDRTNVIGNIYGAALLGGKCAKTSGDNGTSGSATIQYNLAGLVLDFTISVGQTIIYDNPMYRVISSIPDYNDERLYIGLISWQHNFSNVSDSSANLNPELGVYVPIDTPLVAGQVLERYINVPIITTCLVEGTLITLADGSHKRVEAVKYNDLLRVWNLETGEFDYQYPLAIVKGEQHNAKYRITIEDGSYLDICGQHDIFDPVAHKFRIYGEGGIMNVEDEDYYVMKDIGSSEYLRMKITNIEVIEEKVTAYGIITSGIITAFANDMMIGLGVLNLVPITEENKFSDVFEKSKPTWYNYNRFRDELYSGGTEDLITGMNLLMVDVYHKDVSGLDILLAPFMNRRPLPLLNGREVHFIAFDDNGLNKINAHKDDIIVLPEIKSEGKNRWYILGEYKYLYPGDSYRIKVSTVIKAVE